MTTSSKLSEYQYQIGDLGAFPTTSGAFDGNISSQNANSGTWYATTTVGVENYKNTGVIGQDFARDVIITAYKLYIHPTIYSTYNNALPKSWTFEGWNGSSWVVLDTKSNYASSLVSGWNTISINNTDRYSKYRLNITSNNGNALYLTITEIEFWGYEYIVALPEKDTGNFYLESDSINNSTVITDISDYEYPVLTFGTPVHSTDDPKIGTSSIYFDGSSSIEVDVVSNNLFLSNNRSLLDKGAVDFTIDCWVKCASAMSIFSLGSPGSGSGTTATYRQGLALSIASNRVYLTAGNLSTDGSSGYMSYNTPGNFNYNQWVHISLVSYNNQPFIFINGVSQTLTPGGSHGSNTFSNTKLYSPRHINIGSYNKYNGVTDTTIASSSSFFTGSIDSYRIVIGRAMWTEDFTPPTTPYISGNDFVFEDGASTVTSGNEAHFNFLPDEDYHILTLSASLPMLTMEAESTAKLPPYNAINIDFPILTCEMEGDSWRGDVGDCYGEMEITLPILECVIYSGGAVIDITLPVLIVEMSTPIEPIFAQMDCLIPILELEMLQITPISAYMSAVIPILTASIEGDCKFTGMNISLPVPTMRAYSGAEMAISLPVPNFSMTASAAKAGYLTASLPVPQFIAYSGAMMEITLPVPTVEMVADTPIIATMNVNLKILFLIMSATSLAPTKLEATLPIPQLVATSRGCLFNSMNCTLPLIDVEMSGINGGVAALESEIPMLHMIMQGFFHREGGNYIDITLPILAMYSEAYGTTTSEILRHVRGQER